jgi:hypothetical protein
LATVITLPRQPVTSPLAISIPKTLCLVCTCHADKRPECLGVSPSSFPVVVFWLNVPLEECHVEVLKGQKDHRDKSAHAKKEKRREKLGNRTGSKRGETVLETEFTESPHYKYSLGWTGYQQTRYCSHWRPYINCLGRRYFTSTRRGIGNSFN